MGSVNYAQAIKPDTAHIKKLIENSLLGDWIIRIEYESREQGSRCWQQWENAFFALRSADDVIAAIRDCYSGNADCAIRINAEKIQPQTRMLNTIYNPHFLQSDSEMETDISSVPYQRKRDQLPVSPGLTRRN